MNHGQKDIARKKRILNYAEACGNVNKACRHFGVTWSNFYLWRNAFRKSGDVGLISRKPIAKSYPNQTPAEIIEKVLHLRQTYHLGPIRIVWYLARYHDIKISCAGVYRILKRNGVSRPPRGTRLRMVHTKRYQKQVPGHHIQVDVKLLTFQGKDDKPIKRYQYTAIDDANRVRALKIYERHNQASAINFID
jgi:transposase